MKLPLTYEEISEEINRFTALPKEEIQNRVWNEALNLGANANRDVQRIGVTPHVFNSRMEKLYQETDAFIFECLVFWAKSSRQLWTNQAYERIKLFAEERNINLAELKILIFGDGVGNDSLYLTSKGLLIDYFDVPGSKTFEFAARRFEYYGVAKKNKINLITDYSALKKDYYDVVLSFEVLEHLPDPVTAIGDIAGFLKSGGIALITEAFEHLYDSCPTHLESNRQYSGRTFFLFRAEDMTMTWYSRLPLFKPMEFRKQAKSASRLTLLRDKRIVGNYLNNRFAFFKVKLKAILDKRRADKREKSAFQAAQSN